MSSTLIRYSAKTHQYQVSVKNNTRGIFHNGLHEDHQRAYWDHWNWYSFKRTMTIWRPLYVTSYEGNTEGWDTSFWFQLTKKVVITPLSTVWLRTYFLMVWIFAIFHTVLVACDMVLFQGPYNWTWRVLSFWSFTPFFLSYLLSLSRYLLKPFERFQSQE